MKNEPGIMFRLAANILIWYSLLAFLFSVMLFSSGKIYSDSERMVRLASPLFFSSVLVLFAAALLAGLSSVILLFIELRSGDHKKSEYERKFERIFLIGLMCFSGVCFLFALWISGLNLLPGEVLKNTLFVSGAIVVFPVLVICCRAFAVWLWKYLMKREKVRTFLLFFVIVLLSPILLPFFGFCIILVFVVVVVALPIFALTPPLFVALHQDG